MFMAFMEMRKTLEFHRSSWKHKNIPVHPLGCSGSIPCLTPLSTSLPEIETTISQAWSWPLTAGISVLLRSHWGL